MHKYKQMMKKRRTRTTDPSERGQCKLCGKILLKRSIPRHMRIVHDQVDEKYTARPKQDEGTYCMKVSKTRRNACPINGWPCGGRDKHSIYRHFCLRHPMATIIVEEDGELPRCPLCGYFTNNIDRHQRTEACRKGRTRRINEVKQDEQEKISKVEFYVNGKKIERVHEFKYLG